MLPVFVLVLIGILSAHLNSGATVEGSFNIAMYVYCRERNEPLEMPKFISCSCGFVVCSLEVFTIKMKNRISARKYRILS